MGDVEKIIKGDWFDIRQAVSGKPNDLIDYFQFTPNELAACKNGLRSAVEEGITEYKQSIIRNICSALAELEYTSKGLVALKSKERAASLLIFSCAAQLFIVEGKIKLSTQIGPPGLPDKSKKPPPTQHRKAASDQDQPATFPQKESLSANQSAAGETTSGNLPHQQGPADQQHTTIQDIIVDIQERTSKNQALKQHPKVKLMLAYFKQYREELASMDKLKPHIPKDKLPGFAENFKTKFSQLSINISDLYNQFIKEQDPAPAPVQTSPPLERFPLAQTASILQTQTKEFSRLYSTIRYAHKERFLVRELLVKTAKEQSNFLQLIISEQKKYAHIAPFEKDAYKINRAFCTEIMAYLERHARNS